MEEEDDEAFLRCLRVGEDAEEDEDDELRF
jgi:hypothetical protein